MAIKVYLGTISHGAKRVVKIDCTQELTGSEVLTGTPLVTERTTTDLTITRKIVNTAVETINGASVAIGCAIRFYVVGAKAATGSYIIDISCGTTSSPDAETLTYEGRLDCV